MKTNKVLAIYSIWSFLNIFIWVYDSRQPGYKYQKNNFSHLLSNIEVHGSESYPYFYFAHNSKPSYDIVEFMVWVVAPVILFFTIKLFNKK